MSATDAPWALPGIAGFTALTEAHGDDQAADGDREHAAGALRHGGEEHVLCALGSAAAFARRPERDAREASP